MNSCLKRNQKSNELSKKVENNPYVKRALYLAIIAFGLSIFPWPRTWHVGTSLWMRLLVLVLSQLADYFCTKAIQVNRYYGLHAKQEIKPRQVKIATILAILTTVMATYSITMF